MLIFIWRFAFSLLCRTNKKGSIMSEENREEKMVTDNDEIKELNKTVLGKLDNPLVVHKKSDASYDENAPAFEMSETHTDEARPTLMRHRFKKEKKSRSGYIFILVIIAILAVVFAALYYTGNITFNEKETSSTTETTTQTTTSITDLYEGTIVVKDMYIFVNGIEVDGIEGLQNALEYEDKSTTAFTIIDENANSDYLNFEILPILEQLGFYDERTEITHKASTGLIAQAEKTTALPETESEKSTEKTVKTEKKE